MLKKINSTLLFLISLFVIISVVHTENPVAASSETSFYNDCNFEPAETYFLSLLHEGRFPQKKTFSRDLSKEGDIIKNALFSRDSYVVLDAVISAEELINLYETVINSEPELFYVTGTVGLSSDDENGKHIIYPQYEAAAQLFAYDSGTAFKQEVNNILGNITDDMSDIEKAMAVHDYMARFYEYDYTYENSDINDIFTDKKGVCQAYADAYTYIMKKKLGIDCYTLSSLDLNHAWNVIKIDGEWYHVDVTWDDPSFNGKDYFGAVRHEYFLISSDTIRDDIHRHDTYDWEVSEYSLWKYDFVFPSRVVEPTSERFDNYIWSETGYSPFIRYNDNWYYVLNGTLYTYDFASNRSETVKELTYGTIYDVFDIYQNTVIFKCYWENEVQLFPMNGSGYRTLEQLDNAYSFRTKQDMLQYVIYDENDVPAFYELDLSDMEFTVPTPQISVQTGANVTISLSADMGNVTYYYTTDGTNPSLSSSSANQITVSSTGKHKIKLLAVRSGYNYSTPVCFYIRDGRLIYWEDVKSDSKTADLISTPVNQNGNVITPENASLTTSVKLNIENLCEENQESLITVAFYDSNSRLISAGRAELTLSELVTAVEIPITGKPAKASEIKVFMWGGLSAFDPLSETETFYVR